jgi:integrase
MKGGIYSDEKCPICEGGMRDNGRTAVCCSTHPKQHARSLIVRFGRNIFKRFTEYSEASRFLNGLRFKTDENTFDARDYKRANPLGFAHLADKYLAMKEQTIKHGTFASLRPLMERAKNFFGNRNVKELNYGDLEDFFLHLKKDSGLASKTIYNLRGHLHNFWEWLCKRKEIPRDLMPEFPEISFEMGWRRTLDKTTQESVLDEIWEITRKKTPRAWFAILLLSSNVNVRPGELEGVLEDHVDLERRCILIHDHKTKRHTQAPKTITLLDEDVEFIRSLPKGFPHMPFFRRDVGGGGRHANTAFGRHFLQDVWDKACRNLGVSGVSLYPGTRHSTCQFFRQLGKTPEEVKRLTDHTTNKAFDRYLEIQAEEKRTGVELARRKRETKCTVVQINKDKKPCP